MLVISIIALVGLVIVIMILVAFIISTSREIVEIRLSLEGLRMAHAAFIEENAVYTHRMPGYPLHYSEKVPVNKAILALAKKLDVKFVHHNKEDYFSAE